MMHMIAALHTINDSTDHDGKVDEDAAHAHKTLSAGMHGTADEFSHGMLLQICGPFRPNSLQESKNSLA